MITDHQLSTELQLLILLSYPNASTYWPERIAALIPLINQAHFIRLVRFHRVALAVSRNIKPQWQHFLLPSFLSQLEQNCRWQQQRCKQQYLQQCLVERSLTAAGITHRFFKGLALSQLLYQDLSWRFSKDIDLLIGIADRERASSVLLQLGFASEFEPFPPAGLGTRLRKALQKDCVFKKTDGTILELHWRLDNAHCRYSNHMAQFYLTEPDGCSVDEFVYLCLHAAKSQCHRVKWLIDVAVYALKLQQTIPDWQQQAQLLARRYGVLAYLNVMLLLIRQSYGNLVPITVVPKPAEKTRLNAIFSAWQEAALPKRATLRSVIQPFLIVANAGYTLRLLLNLAFWPNLDDVNLLNRLATPLNYLFLPLFPLYKLGRYLVRVIAKLVNKRNVKPSNDSAF